MAPEQPTDLDYDLLDDVLPGITNSTHRLIRDLFGCRAVAIGSLMEYAFQIEDSQCVFPNLMDVAPSEMATELEQVFSKRWANLHAMKRIAICWEELAQIIQTLG